MAMNQASESKGNKKSAAETEAEWSVTNMLMQAYVHVDRKEFEEAQVLLEKVLKREPDNELVLKYQKVLETARDAAAEASTSDDDDEDDDDDDDEGETGTETDATDADTSTAESSAEAESPRPRRLSSK